LALQVFSVETRELVYVYGVFTLFLRMDNAGLWTSIITAAVLALLPVLFPRGTAVRRHFTPAEMQALEPHQRRLGKISGVVVLVSMLGGMALSMGLLVTLHRAVGDRSFDYPFPFMEVYWIWPGMAFGIALSFYVTHWVLGRFLGPQYDLLMEAGNQQYGVNSEKALRGLFWFCFAVGLAGTGLGYNWYAGVRADTQEIVINPFLGLGEYRYPLRDITSVTYVDYYAEENGHRYHQPYYRFRFRNGYQWDTHEGFRAAAPNRDSATVGYLLRQTGLRADTVARRD
jgi:hypothetical protein